ncbi:hypothetical protein EPUS_07130 [Endocarpon pusillum Z07020]|uniref:Uncharacterized protein n=1 Tax=Endocarpon pusillum (strain Z07020 / HMAS-L-300199) TaxID=1263415 RepID=U1GMA2_ENDPU|nr:uncharacterized protein EPUS_07130 [Endocarpon pusillum Z07020]ERF73036.1 hypothetical protein EPUS_07130 [Endocarpon pusillum Z07020]
METVSLAAAVPGLLTSCLDLIERIDSYKSFDVHSRQLLLGDKLSNEHHARLDYPEVASVVKTILSSVCEIFQKSEHTRTRLRLQPEQANPVASPWPVFTRKNTDMNKAGRNASSAKIGIAWAVKYRGQFTNQVEMFEVLVDKLYELVPPNRGEGQIQKRNDHGDRIDAITNMNMFSNFQRDLDMLMKETRRNAITQAYKAIDEWLDATEFDQQYDKHVSARLEGTCDWIFDHPAYREWISMDYLDKAAKFFWICAPAGHGKSVLCARLVQRLAETAAFPLAYVFSSSHVQAGGQPDGIIRSWISQWTKHNQIAFDLVRDNLQSGKVSRRASQAEIWVLFETVVSQVESCTCILDGFDEYNQFDDNRRDFLRMLKKVVAGTRTRCLVASRGETDIELELYCAAGSSGKQTMLECRFSKNKIQADIDLYSKTVVAKKLPSKDESFQQELATHMAKKCEGMFLWIKLQQEQLRGGKSKKELRNIVKSMPSGLAQSYARNWTNIMNLSETDRHRAISILRWTTFALRPLTIAELTEALIVEPEIGSANLAVDDLPEEINQEYIDDEIKSLCGSLVEIRSAAPTTPPGSQTIYLVHVSIKEYLLSVLPAPLGLETISTSIPWDAVQNIDLAKVCLRYLNFKNV